MNYNEFIQAKKKHIGYARKMRQSPTKAEQVLWEYLKNKQLGHRFVRQHIISGSIADFACPSLLLIIEVDGKYHEKQQKKDERRDNKLHDFAGYTTLRFTNEEVLHNVQPVLETITGWLRRAQQKAVIG